MRIHQLSSVRQFGRGERHFVDLTKGLWRHGPAVCAVTTPASLLLSELQQLPAGNVLPLPCRRPLDLASAWKLRLFAREHEIEIIHAHMARDYPLAAFAVGKWGPR